MKKSITIPYGSTHLSFDIPEENLAAVLAPKEVPACPDVSAEIERALSSPLDTPLLAGIVRPGEHATILVDDYTRATPAAQVLPILVAGLNRAGIPDANITILISTGTHRLCTPAEVEAKVGAAMCARIPVIQHDCTDRASQVFIGITSRGTPVWVHRQVLETDRLFGIGHIDPSDYAGYAGGYKLVVPGVAALETVDTNHALAVLSTGRRGRLEFPCRQDIEEAGSMVRTDLFINCVLNQDSRLAQAWAGSPAAVHATGMVLARQVYEVDCPEVVDIAVASAYPYDVDFYQAIRAIEYAGDIVRPGGTIVVAAACPDGTGSDEFYHLLVETGRDPAAWLRQIAQRHGKVTYNLLGYFLAQISARKRVVIVTDGLSAAELGAIGFDKRDSIQEALDSLLLEYGPRSRVAVLPVGSATLPILREEMEWKASLPE